MIDPRKEIAFSPATTRDGSTSAIAPVARERNTTAKTAVVKTAPHHAGLRRRSSRNAQISDNPPNAVPLAANCFPNPGAAKNPTMPQTHKKIPYPSIQRPKLVFMPQ